MCTACNRLAAAPNRSGAPLETIAQRAIVLWQLTIILARRSKRLHDQQSFMQRSQSFEHASQRLCNHQESFQPTSTFFGATDIMTNNKRPGISSSAPSWSSVVGRQWPASADNTAGTPRSAAGAAVCETQTSAPARSQSRRCARHTPRRRSSGRRRSGWRSR